MEKQPIDEKMQQYFRLMRLRRDFVLSVLVIPTVFIIVLLLVRAEEKYLSIYLSSDKYDSYHIVYYVQTIS
ncbi:hypothetical protein OHW08_09130 [Acinetobacter baumannii]|nr:hypothetical protein [Acinetobacter baumannii]MDC4882192.1 hypothetical protein [Acinetobacter baumannii]MDC4889060.1 hypothetical protein [Acinetobacter baumannii]MDC4903314.1 hypothetical protein [Acinetobacter baumannii]MDC4911674.1 hypothetical protein [Acinetobacter baumannii]